MRHCDKTDCGAQWYDPVVCPQCGSDGHEADTSAECSDCETPEQPEGSDDDEEDMAKISKNAGRSSAVEGVPAPVVATEPEPEPEVEAAEPEAPEAAGSTIVIPEMPDNPKKADLLAYAKTVRDVLAEVPALAEVESQWKADDITLGGFTAAGLSAYIDRLLELGAAVE